MGKQNETNGKGNRGEAFVVHECALEELRCTGLRREGRIRLDGIVELDPLLHHTFSMILYFMS